MHQQCSERYDVGTLLFICAERDHVASTVCCFLLADGRLPRALSLECAAVRVDAAEQNAIIVPSRCVVALLRLPIAQA